MLVLDSALKRICEWRAPTLIKDPNTCAHIWYFAYGSNLDKNQMLKRIGEWKKSQRALVKGWTLTFNFPSGRWQGKAANIIETGNPKDTVCGAIYYITKKQLENLSRFEGKGARLLEIEVESEGSKIRAKAYVFNPDLPSGKPPEKYLERIISGLEQHGYAEDAIAYVKRTAESS